LTFEKCPPDEKAPSPPQFCCFVVIWPQRYQKQQFNSLRLRERGKNGKKTFPFFPKLKNFDLEIENLT